ncbi:MAG: hypothetical protein WCA13_16770 [Terriglobales bacterium]
MRIAAAAGLLACFGWEGLWAQAAPQKLIVHRSTRAIPHKFTVHPNEATVAVNQTQRFEITDAQGRPVAAHWNVSGIGCSGGDCGTIDDQGVYRTPSSLPQPRVVTVEGVLVSDPNYSVLTQVRLEDSVAPAASGAPVQVATGKTQLLTAPEVGIPSLAKDAGLLPLPDAVAAAPEARRQNLASSAGSPPLPNVVAPAPPIARQNLATSAELLPLPNVIAAAPAVGRQDLATSSGSLSLPNVIAAAPAVGRQNLTLSVGSLPLTDVIAAAPAVGRQNLAVSRGSPPLPTVVAPAPAVGRQDLAVSAEVPPLPSVVAVVSPPPSQISIGKAQQFTTTGVARQDVAVRGVLMPVPDMVAAVPVATAVSVEHSPVVTYRDGQLTIDAENSTLATVLQLVAEKTGAVIEVPPGSGTEHIFEHTGPGLANDVLEQLLNGSPFNFIIVSSPQHPNQPAQVLLTLRGADTPILPPQLSADQTSSASAKLKTFSAPPPFVPAEYARSGPPSPQQPGNGSLQPPTDPIPRDVLDQMMKDRIRRANEQFQKQQ